MQTEETFDPNSIDYTGIEPGADFEYRAVKDTTADLEIDEVVLEIDNKSRQVIRVRAGIKSPVEFVYEPGDELLDPATFRAKSVYERFYFHTPKAIPIFAKFLERLGFQWADYVNSPNKKGYVESLKGIAFKAVVVYNADFKSNEIKKILKVS